MTKPNYINDGAMAGQKEMLESRLAKYFDSLDPAVLGEKTKLNVTRLEHMGAGTRHFNYLAVINGRSYNIRFSLTSHPEDHVEYEYRSLKAIENLGVAPKAHYHEASKEHLGIPFVVIEFVRGTHPTSFTPELLENLARAVIELHGVDTGDAAYSKIRRKSSKVGILSITREKVKYISKKAAEYEGNGNLRALLEKTYSGIEGIGPDDNPGAVLSHGDIALSNIIITESGLRLIDWETLNIGDPAYDIATFFDRSDLTQEQKSIFLNEYMKHVADPAGFVSRLEKFEKMRVFDRFCWCIWEAFDVREGARNGFFPEWRTVDLYIKDAKKRFVRCQELGIVPKETGWESLGLEQMLLGKADTETANNLRNEKKVAIFDVDNTLLLTDNALSMAQVKLLGRSMISEEFNQLPRELKMKVIEVACMEFMDMITPNVTMIDRLKELRKNGYAIIVLTSRPSSVERHTMEVLKKYGVEYDQIYHNPNSLEVKQTTFKTAKLPEITKGYGYVEVYDDHRRVFDSYIQNGIKHVFYHVNKGEMLRVS